MKKSLTFVLALAVATVSLQSCKLKKGGHIGVDEDAAKKVYVAPGQYDEYYDFVSGGFSGQVAVYGIPSGRLLKMIPVFSQNGENGYGYDENTKAMLNTSFGFVPWDDSHHTQLSETDAMYDGRWLFINANNTPRIARVDLKTFQTAEIIELPNAAGNHASPFITSNTEYLVAGTRFSVPADYENGDVSISDYKKDFRGHISYIKVDKNTGHLSLDFQLALPPYNYDLSHSGKNASADWSFFTCYNTEEAHSRLEVNASKNDKDYILAINWKKAAEHAAKGDFDWKPCKYAHNVFNEQTEMATSEIIDKVKVIDTKKYNDFLYLIPCPKSPHGVDVDPSGEYIVGNGKLSANLPVFSFTKIQEAIKNHKFDGQVDGINVIKYEAALHGEVQAPGLGSLHTEFDADGNAYTSFFISSEIVKWNLKTLQIEDRIPTYYSVGHLSVFGTDTKKPYGKYMIAYNKITKDCFLPTGPELCQAAQLYDISGKKMKLILEFPTIGEPHYASAIAASELKPNVKLFTRLADNHNPYKVMKAQDTRVVRTGNRVDIYMAAIRSRLVPDNIEGIRLGDEVYVHVTNIEQEWDIPHGFAIKGNNNAELLVMPGETRTLKWVPNRVGIIPFYCTDFCSALHQEMQGYFRVSPKGSNVPLKFTIDGKLPSQFTNSKPTTQQGAAPTGHSRK
ncbi:MAG: Sec-dependent nitrous-oxide reductase [Prevotella sp.]